MKNTFDALIEQIQKFRDERDWKKFHNPKDLAEAIVIEASELLEHFLWKDKKEAEKFIRNAKNFEEVSDELADTFIYLIEFADHLDINIKKAVESKMKKNTINYPVEKSKGKKVKYTKL